MTKPMPPTDWEYSGLVLTVAFLTYQCIEFTRRGDTPARDIAHFMWGLVPMLVAEYLWLEHLVDRVMPHLG